MAIEAAHAVPYIPFKANSRGVGKSDAWRRLWHTLEAQNDVFLKRYHLRSNVESTFSGNREPAGIPEFGFAST